ncbi:MAG: hypothetical protein ACXWC7_00200 [Chitinophagaceae bacterium]
MKKMKPNKYVFLLLPFLCLMMPGKVTAQEDSVVAKELVRLKYFNDNNSVQYLLLENSLKTGKKIEPLKDKIFQVYLDSNKAENLIAEVKTDKTGKAKTFLPVSLKTIWEQTSLHTFIAVPAGKEDVTELEIAKAKMMIDTASSEEGRSITVQVQKFENGEWLPANEVEMRVGVHRLGGILSANEEATFTTDSSGIITVDFKRDSLPGDQKGNIVLIAKVEDNDQYGNLVVEKTVPWGVALKQDSSFFSHRSLWSTRFKTPVWLLFMAYSIVIGVWGTIFYLILQIIKIKKLGDSTA